MIAEISLSNLSLSGWVVAVMMVLVFIKIAWKTCKMMRGQAKAVKRATQEVNSFATFELCHDCGQIFRTGHPPCPTCGGMVLVTKNELELADQVDKLKELCKEADEYLNTNDMTSIGHGSILHRKFQEAWVDEDI